MHIFTCSKNGFMLAEDKPSCKGMLTTHSMHLHRNFDILLCKCFHTEMYVLLIMKMSMNVKMAVMTVNKYMSTLEAPLLVLVNRAIWKRTMERAVLVCPYTLIVDSVLHMHRLLLFIHFHSLDVDECSSGHAHGCNQVCTNTPGSYLCSCYNCSYQISNDGKTCTGTELDLMELF